MGRPSVAAERRRQIIDAALRCLALYGFSGTTLDRIADEAGMARGHVRHFAGNREELLVDAARTFYLDDEEAAGRSSVLPPEASTLASALDYLFGEFAVQDAENPLALALVEAARTIPDIRPILVAAYMGTFAVLRELIAERVPNAAETACEATAYGVLTLALGNAFLSDIEESAERTSLGRVIAEQLLTALELTPAR